MGVVFLISEVFLLFVSGGLLDSEEFTSEGGQTEKYSEGSSRRQKKLPRLDYKTRNLLQLAFNEYRYPTMELKKKLSRQTGLDLEVVNMWMSKRQLMAVLRF